jgi:hypothetical protein
MQYVREFLGIVLICVAVLAGRAFYRHFTHFMGEQLPPAQTQATNSIPLPGMPPNLESSYAAAQAQGSKTFRRWLDYYGPNIADPRLASIELDYVVLVSRENMAEARSVFAAVKARTPTNSPVYLRIKRLEQAYE